MPSMRNVSTIRPAFPGGRFSGGALLARALVSSASNGSRFTSGFSTGGLAEPAAATFLASLDSAGAFAGALAEAFAEALAGAFAGALTVAGLEGFAGGGAGICGAPVAW